MYMYMYELAAILWRLSELKPEHMRMKAMDSYEKRRTNFDQFHQLLSKIVVMYFGDSELEYEAD